MINVPLSHKTAGERQRLVGLAAAALLIYLTIAWGILSPEAIWSPDEGAKLLQLQSLRLEGNHLAFDIAYLGHDVDPAMRFAPVDTLHRLLRPASGTMFLGRLPIFPLLTLPFFALFGMYGLYVIPVLGGVLCGILALLLLEQRDRRLAMWLVIAFATPVFIYATIFWEHTLATTFGLAAAWLVLRLAESRRPHIFGWLAVGILLGASAYIRLELIIFGLALLAASWLLASDRRAGPIAAGLMLGLTLIPYPLLHRALFDQPVPDNALYLFYPFLYLKHAGWRALPDLLIGPFSDEAIDPGWRGWIWSGAAILAIAAAFARDSRLARLIGLAALTICGLTAAAFLFDPQHYRSAHGLLLTTPWAVVGLGRSREVWRRGARRERTIILTIWIGLGGYAIGILLLRASAPHGGLEWGARFALTFYPLLALIAFWKLEIAQRKLWLVAVIGILGALGFGFQMRGLWSIAWDKQFSARLNQAIVAVPEPYVVSELWWVPLNAAPIFERKVLFVADSTEKLADWTRTVYTHGVKQFVLVTLDAAAPAEVAQQLDGYQLTVVDTWLVDDLLFVRLSINKT